MKTHTYRGAIVEESLDDRAALRLFRSLGVSETSDPDPADRWRIHAVEGTREDIRALARALKPVGWYAHFWDDRRHMIVAFRGRLFEFAYDDRRGWDEAVAHGVMVGVPREQLDFRIG